MGSQPPVSRSARFNAALRNTRRAALNLHFEDGRRSRLSYAHCPDISIAPFTVSPLAARAASVSAQLEPPNRL